VSPKRASNKSDNMEEPYSYTLPLILLGFIVLASMLVVFGLWGWTRKRFQPRPTEPRRGESGKSGEQLETDLRLTYKRFKELYPHSEMTYQEYKRLQREKAFKRAVSSQKIKRMVR